jgi:hypothetical protein
LDTDKDGAILWNSNYDLDMVEIENYDRGKVH